MQEQEEAHDCLFLFLFKSVSKTLYERFFMWSYKGTHTQAVCVGALAGGGGGAAGGKKKRKKATGGVFSLGSSSLH